MPLYTYRCCGRSRDAFARVDDRDTAAPECDACGERMARALSAPMVQVPGGLDVRYRCQMSGEEVTSMRRRQYLMDRHNVVDARDFEGKGGAWDRATTKKAEAKAEAAAAYERLPDKVKQAGAQMAKAATP